MPGFPVTGHSSVPIKRIIHPDTWPGASRQVQQPLSRAASEDGFMAQGSRSGSAEPVSTNKRTLKERRRIWLRENPGKPFPKELGPSKGGRPRKDVGELKLSAQQKNRAAGRKKWFEENPEKGYADLPEELKDRRGGGRKENKNPHSGQIISRVQCDVTQPFPVSGKVSKTIDENDYELHFEEPANVFDSPFKNETALIHRPLVLPNAEGFKGASVWKPPTHAPAREKASIFNIMD